MNSYFMLNHFLFKRNLSFWPSVVVYAYNPSSRVTEIRVLQVEDKSMAKIQAGLLQTTLDCHMHCDLWSSLPTEMNQQALRNLG